MSMSRSQTEAVQATLSVGADPACYSGNRRAMISSFQRWHSAAVDNQLPLGLW